MTYKVPFQLCYSNSKNGIIYGSVLSGLNLWLGSVLPVLLKDSNGDGLEFWELKSIDHKVPRTGIYTCLVRPYKPHLNKFRLGVFLFLF